jgi:hypothetical protein
MAIYTIDDYNIMTMHSAVPADGSAGVRFDTTKELAKATADWPVSWLAEIWNELSIDGLKPVKKFKNRKTAVARIWAAIQNLAPLPAPHGAARAIQGANSRKRPQPTDDAHAGREGSKKAIILAMLKNPDGATLKRLMAATGRQPHTVRGFISGAVGKQRGLRVESTRTEAGERRYRILA